MARRKKTLFIGTSGWSYKSWAKEFYPPGTRPADQFGYYAGRFPTVEINATFYRLPTPAAVGKWKAQAPPGFLFAVKAPRAVTHYKKLLPGARSFDLFLETIPALGNRLGPILWQLPGNFRKNVERLDVFLSSLPKRKPRFRHAVEFRHPSWLDAEVFEVLRRHRAALVAVSSLGMPMDLTLTADFTYLRFHGLEGGAAHDYTASELRPWADHLRDCRGKGIEAFAYFNNDINTRAPGNAGLLAEMAGGSAGVEVNQENRRG